MSPPLVALPVELVNRLCKFLDLTDQVHLSTTCVHLRNVVAPIVFKSVEFSVNGASSTAGSALLVTERYGGLIKQLKLVVHAPTCADSDCYCCEGDHDKGKAEVALEDGGQLLNPDAVTLLEAKHALLPNLERLMVEFPTSFGNHDFIYWDDDPEPADEELANRHSARADAIFDLLVRNANQAPPRLTRLSILNLPPRPSPVFESERWCRYLGPIEDFELSLLGEKSEVGMMQSNRLPSYIEFLSGLGNIFFDHLPALKSLKLQASEWAPLGFEDTSSDGDFPFALTEMSSLRDIKLVNILVGDQLLAFLQALQKGPYSLTLTNVKAVRHGLSFHEFFDGLVDKEVPIQAFTLTPMNVSLDDYQVINDSAFAWQVAAAHELQKASPNWPSFTYCWLDEKYGSCYSDLQRSVEAFLEGRDQAAYARFMAKVAKLDRQGS